MALPNQMSRAVFLWNGEDRIHKRYSRMNSHQRRVHMRATVKRILQGKLKIGTVSWYSPHLHQHLLNLPVHKKLQYVNTLLECGRASGGSDLLSILYNMNPIQKWMLKIIVNLQPQNVPYLDDSNLPDEVTLFLITGGEITSTPQQKTEV